MEAEVIEFTQEETDELVTSALAGLGVTADQLKEQAAAGVFDSEPMRRAWFALEGLI